MSARPFNALVIGLLLATATLTSVAATPPPAAATQQATTPQDVTEILQFQHALRAKLESSTGEYSKLEPATTRRVEVAQDKIFQMLAGVTSLDQLNADQKVNLTNALEEVKAVMLANEGNRIICHRERKLGSNMIERRCETVAGRAARTEEANRFMSHDRLNTAPLSGGGG